MAIPPPHNIPPAVRQLAAEIAAAEPMRRGSVSERMVKCSKPGCPCADDPKARHGPYFSFTQAVGGKTRSRFLTAEQAAVVQQQIEAGRKFRGRVDALWEACEEWADRQLETDVASAAEAKKGGSPPVSKRKSLGKSRSS